MISRNIFFFILIILLGTGCDVRSSDTSVTTATPFTITATIPSILTPAPTGTSLPLPPQPTVVPVEGISSTQINVRSEPSTAGNVVGIIPANTKVEILGKDPGGNWWQIRYPQGVDGKGWVTAQYVTTAGSSEVPVVGGDAANPNNGNVAIIQQQINVRSGPGTGFNSLGTLNALDVVNLIGKDANGTWLQIAFPTGGGPDGKGWVNAAFVQANGVENLPIVTEAGEVVGTGTPTGIPFTPTPTVIPAWADNDSQNNPITSVVFEASGTRTLIYNGDISAPEGDTQDWIQFIPYTRTVFASLECAGNASLQAVILENGLATSLDFACGDRVKKVSVKAGSAYLIQVQASESTSGLQYINYTITIQTGT